jgi:hypothetical protein
MEDGAHEHVRAKIAHGVHVELARRRGVAPSASEGKALDLVNIRLLGTAAVVPTVYALVRLLQQAWLFPTQGFRFCYIKHLTLEKQTNTARILTQHSDTLVFASFFRGA